MMVQLSIDEIDLLVDALETVQDQAVDTTFALPEEERAEHVAFVESVADLSAKLSKLV